MYEVYEHERQEDIAEVFIVLMRQLYGSTLYFGARSVLALHHLWPFLLVLHLLQCSFWKSLHSDATPFGIHMSTDAMVVEAAV